MVTETVLRQVTLNMNNLLSHSIFMMYIVHPEHFELKLSNFDFGVIKSCSPKDLNRLEDFYIHSTMADTISLNRYKVVS